MDAKTVQTDVETVWMDVRTVQTDVAILWTDANVFWMDMQSVWTVCQTLWTDFFIHYAYSSLINNSYWTRRMLFGLKSYSWFQNQTSMCGSLIQIR